MKHQTENTTLALAMTFCCFACASAEERPKYEPTQAYEVQQIEGWRIIVNKAFLKVEPALASQTLTLLGHQLYQITRVVPRPALAKLRQVKIWVEQAEPHHPCMCYHPDVEWLRDNDMNPDKAKCVELANARTFLDWTIAQPWMVFHELAHAYHHQFLPDGFDNVDIFKAYQSAMKTTKYDSVLHINGRQEKHYAKTNQMEYFAEASEAYFGTNDFFPFVKSELKQHDEQLHELLPSVWQVTSKKSKD